MGILTVGDSDGVVVAEFDQLSLADAALRDLNRYAHKTAVLVSTSPSLVPTLRQFGIEPTLTEQIVRILKRDAFVVLARVPRGSSAQAVLRILWRRQAQNLSYLSVLPGCNTSRSSPKDQSENASISTSTRGSSGSRNLLA